jgi:hypothetical protein
LDIDPEYIKHNTIISAMVESDNVPMKFSLTAINSKNETLYQVSNDLRKNIHWH